LESKTNYILLKKYFVPLIVVFLFSKVKAESYDSAFSDVLKIIQNDSIKLKLSEKKYELAKKLIEDENYSESLEIAYSLLSLKDEKVHIKANYLLGKIFEKGKNIDLAISHFKKALKIIDKSKINLEDGIFKSELKLIESESLLLIGKTYIDKYRYREQVKIDSSFYFLNRLINIETIEEQIFFFKARGYNNLSIHEYLKKNYEKAEEYSSKSIAILEKLNKEQELSAAYISLANIYEVTNKREKALTTYLKALPYIEHKNDDKSLEYKEILYYNIAWTMYNLKDYHAYNYLEKSYDLKDSLLDVNLRKELKKIEQTHNIDLVRKEAENKRLSLVRNNWFIGILGALVSLLLLYLANLYKLKQKDLSLKLSLKELEQRKKLEKLRTDSQEKIINATIDAKESERKQIAEILHDNVSALLSSANLHLQASEKHFGDDLPAEIEKTKEIIEEASVKIRDLSHELVSSVLLKFGLEYAVKDVAKKFSNSSIKIHTAIADVTRYSQEFEIKVFSIIQELINNILKHSKASSAFIAMEEENSKLLIIIKDNGVGFVKKNQEEAGIGLNQIEARVRMMGGTTAIETSKGNGTKITLEIPVVERKMINALPVQ